MIDTVSKQKVITKEPSNGNSFDQLPSTLPLNAMLEIFKQQRDFPYENVFDCAPAISIFNKHAPSNHHLTIADLPGKEDKQAVENLLRRVFPSLFFEEKHIAISPPFSMENIFRSSQFEEYFDESKWVLKIEPAAFVHKPNSKEIIAAGLLILERFYGVEVTVPYRHVMTMVHLESGLERFFEMYMDSRFVQIEALKPIPELSDAHIEKLLNNIEEPEVWLSTFTADAFKFSGFHIIRKQDITETEVVSRLKTRFLLDQTDLDPEAYRAVSTSLLRSYLGLVTLDVGFVDVDIDSGRYMPERNMSVLHKDPFDWFEHLSTADAEDPYVKVCRTGKPVIISNLERASYGLNAHLAGFAQSNAKSIILMPAMGEQPGKVDGIIEFLSPDPGALTMHTVLKIKELVYLFELGNQRFNREIQNRATSFIQKQFTAIHPSVAWKFTEVAFDHELRASQPDFDGHIAPIAFYELYPLYGQADIVGSSTIRIDAIQEDLLENMLAAKTLITQWLKKERHFLLELEAQKLNRYIESIKSSFVSSDESEIVDFLTNSIHPLIDELAGESSKYPQPALARYRKKLDPELGIVYNKRKRYEQSVNMLNRAIGDFVEQEDDRMQALLPHFFEKYKTDGVEYNLYLGQSLLQNGQFSAFDLKNFRIWQLEMMIKITSKTKSFGESLPMFLETAQLIFVYNNTLNIRFRVDEKQFDVDGAYNVRYEILKKRIDKATVKGSNERLTLSGKVAIVFLQEKDKQEYVEYLNFFVQKGWIDPEIEFLELNRLQGAEGLKALRVTPIQGL
ncbi:MAG: hypothetical protein AB8F95_04185 [Bacteroidia bacterium]